MTHSKHFKLFLWIYTIALLFHISGLEWNLIAGIGILLGFVIAWVAHMSHGYWTLGLIMAHMGLEWSQHITSGIYYSTREFLINGFHALLDFIFIWQEAKIHAPQYFRYIIIGVPAIIIIAFTLFNIYGDPSLVIETHEEATLLESLIIGGILGCTFSHLFDKGHKED